MRHRIQRTLLLAALSAVVLAGFTTVAIAADPPVKVTFTATPAALGAQGSVKAVVTINDGSTLQGLKWTQTGGLPVTLSNATTDTVSVGFSSDRKAYKDKLYEVLEEMPVAAADLPANIPAPSEFAGGLQDRWGVVAVVPHALAEAGDAALDLAVTTTSGTYHFATAIEPALPWPTATGNRNVPVNSSVLLQGKTQASYNWSLVGPPGSNAKLTEATTQHPEFTPDLPGTYQLTVTDQAINRPVGLTLYAGQWKGIITGKAADGTPTWDTGCVRCHAINTPTFDQFTPWSKSGHAQIFTQNVNTPNGHYGTGCLSCHAVGYGSSATANGIDQQQGWSDFLASGLLTHGDPLNWSKILTQFPAVARMANIQCENCHGPQDSMAHMQQDGSRQSLSSDLCGTCHGEPARHGRFQQWQLSGHANYTLAVEEGTSADCSKCHSAQGFLQWQDKNFTTSSLTVDWTTEDVHPQTCQTCHDPHYVGTDSASGKPTNATVRVSGKTPMLMAGFAATDVGNAALCMTCHNGRRGLRDDAHFTVADATRAPHEGPQADILMGQNLYFTKVGTRGFHAMVDNSCVTCHMEKTAQPSTLSVSGSGTNHTFYASNTICSKCHSEITADSVQGPIMAKVASLKSGIETAIKNSMQAQIRAGNAIDLGGKKTVKNAADISSVELISSHGRQGVNVTTSTGKVTDLSLATVKVVRPAGGSVEIYSVTDPAVAKAGWNYFMVMADKSKGVHNPAFVNSALDVSNFAVNFVNATTTAPASSINAGLGGGLGNGAGAVACTTPYVYWAQITGHGPGANGSQWRTDLIARNLGTSPAALKFVFHQPGGNVEGTGSVTAGGQKAFEDVVSTLGLQNNMGPLEICSDQPLLVNGRIFNQADNGTFGQNFDGNVADLGYSAGQTVNLIGLRQQSGAYRSNIIITNGGTAEAQVTVNLFDATGAPLNSYNLTIPAGLVTQDNEPFVNHASRPDVGWGYATVTVVKGANVQVSASLIDAKTNDPTTIPAKQ